MTDRNGKDLHVGDRVYVLPRQGGAASGVGHVRAIKIDGHAVDKACVDDSSLNDDQVYTWSAWCRPDELERI